MLKRANACRSSGLMLLSDSGIWCDMIPKAKRGTANVSLGWLTSRCKSSGVEHCMQSKMINHELLQCARGQCCYICEPQTAF